MNSKKIYTQIKQISSSSTLQSFPGVGWVVAGLNDSIAYADKILYKKCREFLGTIADLTLEEQRYVLDSFDSTYANNEDRQEFGERLLEYMNSMNDSYKAMLAAKVFRYWMSRSKEDEMRHKNMSENDFYHVLEMMNNIPVDVLKAIEDRYSRHSYSILHDKYSLVQYGLYTLKVDTDTLNKSLAQEFGSKTDDLIKQTRYGEILENAIWNGKLPEKRSES